MPNLHLYGGPAAGQGYVADGWPPHVDIVTLAEEVATFDDREPRVVPTRIDTYFRAPDPNHRYVYVHEPIYRFRPVGRWLS